MSIARLRWLYGLQGAALGLLLPFLVPLLAGRGLTATEIGLVLGASGLVTLASYPMWGALADGRLGRRAALVASAAVAVVGGLWLAVAGSDPIVLTAAVSVALVGAMPWGPISDAIALESLGDRSSSYGTLRAWASVGWAATAIAAGLAWDRVGGSAVAVAFGLFAITVALAVLVPGAVRRLGSQRAVDPRAAEEAAEATADVVRPDVVRREWRRVFASPIFLGFLAGLLIVSIGEHATWRYVSLRIIDQGGSALLVGLAAALPALVEIPVFLGSRRWERILGLRWMYVVGALFSAVIALLIALATDAWMVALLRTLDGTAYALRYIGVVLIIGALLPIRLQAFGQSMGWLVSAGVAPIIADMGGGFIYDAVSGSAVFVASAALGAIGAVVVFLALAGAGLGRRVPARSRDAPEGEAARVVVER